MAEIHFIDGEPPGKRGRNVLDEHDVEEVSNMLRKNAGKWAIIEDDTNSTRVSAWRDALGTSFEISQRMTGDADSRGKPLYTVYARRRPLHEDSPRHVEDSLTGEAIHKRQRRR